MSYIAVLSSCTLPGCGDHGTATAPRSASLPRHDKRGARDEHRERAGRPLPHSAAGGAVGFDPWRDVPFRPRHRAHRPHRWTAGPRLHLLRRRCRRRRHPQPGGAGPRTGLARAAQRRRRGNLGSHVVAPALRRSRRHRCLRNGRGGYRALGSARQECRSAPVAFPRRRGSQRDRLRRRHRPAVLSR